MTRKPPPPGSLPGPAPESRHIAAILDDPNTLDSFQILTIPGGFSFGDDLGAGRILASRGSGRSSAITLQRFRDRGGLVLGICNGFQVLVKAGLLPGLARRRWDQRLARPSTTRATSSRAGFRCCQPRVLV